MATYLELLSLIDTIHTIYMVIGFIVFWCAGVWLLPIGELNRQLDTR